MERQINSPRFSFAFAFIMVMLGTHKPQQQATLTNKNTIPEIFFRFRFRNSTERKSKILGFLFLFACNCFCEDGSLDCENFCPLQGSFGSFGPKVVRRVRHEFPSPLGFGGRSSPKSSRKRAKTVETESIVTRFELRLRLFGELISDSFLPL